MSKFFVPTLFTAFFLFIGLPMAFLSGEPDKKCHELVGSSRFNGMIEKLQGKLPIEISERNETIWDENGLVNYSELLSAIDKFMAQVMTHNKANSVRAVYDEDIISRRANANKFLDVIHKDVVKILEERIVSENTLPPAADNVWFTVKQVLNEALECAIEVNQFMKKGENLAVKETWTRVDKKFETAFQTIWVLYESDQFYNKCHGLAESTYLTNMISKLEQKIPINGENNILEAESQMTYDKLLSVIGRFISKMKDAIKMRHKKKYSVTTEKALKDYSDFLAEKCGTTDFYGELVDVFVGPVLGQALECSTGVHKFTQNLKTLQNGVYAKEPKNDWTKVDEKFEAELQKFWTAANIVWHPLMV